MLHGLFIASLLGAGYQLFKEAFEKPVPAENWGNKELIYQDRMNGVSEKQILKNVENGKYVMKKQHPEPHRDPVDGKIVIENCKLYDEDLFKYGAVQTMKWVREGKYNLTPEELEKERERIRKKLDRLYRK